MRGESARFYCNLEDTRLFDLSPRAAALARRRRPLILTLDKRARITADGMVIDLLPAFEARICMPTSV